jgi:pimeloyl-[acyl-carrier protein] methyl ester esterase
MRLFLPGWGAAPEVWAPFASPGDRLGGEIDAGAHVVACSLGAMRALEAATSLDLGSLTLIGACAQFVRDDGHRLGWPRRVLERMRERLKSEPEAVLEEFIRLTLAPGETFPPLPRERDLALLDEGLAFLERYSMLDRAAQIRCPVRLLHGGQDRVCPVAAAELLTAALPQAELTVWPEAGHLPFLSQSDRFRAWLEL